MRGNGDHRREGRAGDKQLHVLHRDLLLRKGSRLLSGKSLSAFRRAG
jgi:hypothetical protein